MPDLTRPTDDEVRKPFKRENRYIVLKRKHLVGDQAERIYDLLDELGVRANECVVVDADWPEYETVWQMIEARCTGRATPQPPIAAEAGERKLRPCSTVCKGSLIVADTASTDAPSSFRIECEDCGAIGSEAPTEAEAVNAWNQRGDSYMALAEEIIRGLTECGNRMSVGDQVRLAHRLATLTPPERTAGEGIEAVLRGVNVARNRLAPLMKNGEDNIWRPAQFAYEVLGNAEAALRQPATDRESVTLTKEETIEAVQCLLERGKATLDSNGYLTLVGASDRESVIEEAARVADACVSGATHSVGKAKSDMASYIATAIRNLKDQPHDHTDMPGDDGLWDIRT